MGRTCRPQNSACHRFKSAASEGGKEVDFGVVGDVFVEGVGQNFAVDGDRSAFAEAFTDTGIALVEEFDQSAHGGGVDLNLFVTTRQVTQ